MKKSILIVSLFLSILSDSLAQTSPFEKLGKEIQAEQLKNDVDVWMDWLHATHPDLSYTVKDIDHFYEEVERIKSGITAPMTVLEFWREISSLNSQLSDGHLIVGHITGGVVKDYLSKGGVFFPFEVVFDKGDLVIESKLAGEPTEFAGYTITRINNLPITDILNELTPRINGDSEKHRQVLLQRKFALLHMLFYGESKLYEVELRKGGDVKMIKANGISALPKFYHSATFDQVFSFEILDEKNAVVTVNEFGWENSKDYYDFMDSVFTTLTQRKIDHLIIDVRENGGGDDEYWMNGILKYIADQPYRWGSSYKKKILGRFRDPGEVIGTVIEGEIDTLIQPAPKLDNRFLGDVSVLVGPYTYSSAILFANTVQDYGFGRLVGEPTGGKSGQTGAIQFSSMPHSGLPMIAPRFYLVRPSGSSPLDPVKPDLMMEYDRLDSKKMLESILRK
ncbi:hypothetical protein D0X99_16480 [Algoriphagus lacus]|uniref:Tail specific protease domain-containing protein n=1 Tax=Algoriphagus lacus TaxID=2056311 RepID=A0A418PNS4_9BACT|nr:S41 family peptidase [Algoriphagus lacus]RIW13370.1 hypothetical protein D0X99_16480 [Algoriphagus lacus]